MSTQSIRPQSPEAPEFKTQEDQDESYADMKFVLDEPWKVKILPYEEPKRLPPGVLPKPEPLNPRQLPWRPGDVTRLKEDTPEGMMKYIATHTTGWWQEMAQRALRDTERAQRRAEEAGVQYGQYWTLELDAETKEKLRLAEEARRARAEAEHAKEAAAKEAFAQRQRELLEKAGRAPRCEYRYTDGRGCRAPQVRGERWCHGHEKMMSYRPDRLELVPMEDEQSVAVNLYRVTKSLASGRITEKMAALMLWSVAIGAPGARKTLGRERSRTNTNNSGVTDDKSFVFGMDGEVSRRRGRNARLPMAAEDFTAKDAESAKETRRNSPQTGAEERRSETGVGGEGMRISKNGLLDIHQEGVVEKHQHQAVDQRYLGKRLKIKEAEPGRGWHEGCNSLGNGKVSRDAADLDPSFGSSALIQDDGLEARRISKRRAKFKFTVWGGRIWDRVIW